MFTALASSTVMRAMTGTSRANRLCYRPRRPSIKDGTRQEEQVGADAPTCSSRPPSSYAPPCSHLAAERVRIQPAPALQETEVWLQLGRVRK